MREKGRGNARPLPCPMAKTPTFGDGRRRGDRMRTKVRTARGRKLSSTRWLERQLNDPYVAAAKKDGYRSRAAYKIIEMDDRFNLFTPGACVIDLGSAPGAGRKLPPSVLAVQRKKGRRKKDLSARLIFRIWSQSPEWILSSLISLMTARLPLYANWPDAAPCGDIRHGRACYRPSPDRPFTHNGVGRGRRLVQF